MGFSGRSAEHVSQGAEKTREIKRKKNREGIREERKKERRSVDRG